MPKTHPCSKFGGAHLALLTSRRMVYTWHDTVLFLLTCVVCSAVGMVGVYVITTNTHPISGFDYIMAGFCFTFGSFMAVGAGFIGPTAHACHILEKKPGIVGRITTFLMLFISELATVGYFIYRFVS